MAQSIMLAARLHQHGDPSVVVRIEEIPVPRPAAGEVLVRMQAAPVHPSDLLHIQLANYSSASLPAGIGFEGVGHVKASGGGLLGKLLVGKRVCVLHPSGGTWGEYCVVSARNVIPVSASHSLERAANFFINPASAYLLTRQLLSLRTGEWLLQSAAASTVGRNVVSLGKHFGFRTINLVRRDSQIDELRALGADEVIAITTDDAILTLQERIQARLGGNPLRAAIDPVGGQLSVAMLQSLCAGGRLILYGSLAPEPISIGARDLVQQQATIDTFSLKPAMQKMTLVAKLQLIRQLSALHLSGRFPSVTCQRLRLAELPKHLARTSQRAGGTKLLIGIGTDD